MRRRELILACHRLDLLEAIILDTFTAVHSNIYGDLRYRNRY